MSRKLPGWVRTIGRLARSSGARQDAYHEVRRRIRGAPPLPDGEVERVVVLCHGNICRSPFAAALLARRLPALEVRSAGLQAGDGNPADPVASRCAARLGVTLDAHRSRRVRGEELDWADLILVMEGSQAAAVARGWPAMRPRVRLLGDFLDAPPHLLEDPWGQPQEVFEAVFCRVRAAVESLAARIEASR